MIRITMADLESLCRDAAIAAGASIEAALSLARATVAAEAEGNRAVGLDHLPYYLDALAEGRIDGWAEPMIERPLPAIIHVDARGGTAHLGYDRAHDLLVEAARTCGIGLFAQRNAYTCGSLGTFVQRLAAEGLIGLAATNGPALMTVPGARAPVYCTNPLAFAAPMADGDTLLIDQASSQTAYVKVRDAAVRGDPLPEGWAIDADGHPTTDATAALKGALLTFGGARGANIALMVEVLAAGLTGANWSLEAPSITQGNRSPGTGLLVIAIQPQAFGAGFEDRLAMHARRLESEGVHLPGRSKAKARRQAASDGLLVCAEVLAQLRSRGQNGK
ncbi:Ldh family oxidoreductase [Aquibium carbonis]|uniref:Ldh family oxidoreductase n=1 Tax=Aquibium carbonis TaxID=2495581 RepID=A0A3R9YU09_9HYPH|nr:Ldh family oxidoreductase [Aquibium carbonis]RST87080.1 Ldh family oxidoreductase [Aquibium carbonis]